MKKTLVASTALLSVSLAAGPTFAADGIRLGIGGFKSAYLANLADDALASACIVPPGGTGNVSTFSPNQWGANTPTADSVCTGVDDRGDAQKLVSITPSFAGFQMTLSYAPNGGDERHGDGVGAQTGMPGNADGESRHNVSAYGAYSFEGDGWGLTAGAGASLEGHVEQAPGPDRDEQEFYQTGLNLTFGNFGVGGVLEYYNDLVDQGATDLDRWVAGGGVGYTLDAWTFGAQYAHLDQDSNNSATADEFQQDRLTLTGNYALGPGINLDGEVGYSWIDTDPEAGAVDGTEVDDYNGFEIGIGTNFTF